MGREIRRVPPRWEHPRYPEGGERGYIPMFDESYEDAGAEWERDCVRWANGEHPDQASGRAKGDPRPRFFWDWDSQPPNPENYRPAFTEEPSWWQVYENVSEGTPVTPPFASAEELIAHLITHGMDDGWGNRLTRAAAEAFVRAGYAPTFVAAGGVITLGYEAASVVKRREGDAS